jgi:hypothetical protein
MLVVTQGAIRGQPFDRAQAQVNLADQWITLPSASIQSGMAQINVSGTLHHPRESFTTGQVQISAHSDQVDLARLTIVQKEWPNTSGVVNLNADAAIDLTGAPQLTSLRGNLSVGGLQWQGQTYGDLSADAATAGTSLNYTATSNFARSNMNVKGSTQLTSGYGTTASATLNNLRVERVLAIAKRIDILGQGYRQPAAVRDPCERCRACAS